MEDNSRKLLTHARIQTICLILAVLMAACGILLAARGINYVQIAADQIVEALDQVDFDQMNASAASLKDAADSISSFDVEKLNSTMDALNSVISALQTVSEKLASIFGS